MKRFVVVCFAGVLLSGCSLYEKIPCAEPDDPWWKRVAVIAGPGH